MSLRPNRLQLGLVSLTIFLSIVFLNCQVWAANTCADMFSQNETTWMENFERSSELNQSFWTHTGETFRSTLETDLNRQENMVQYKKAIQERHPHIQFLHSLGIYFVNGQFKVPSFITLMEKLNAKLNSSGIALKPHLIWTLKSENNQPEQSLKLEPLREFPQADLQYVTRTTLLKNSAFTKMIATGEFPIGGLEAAAGYSRRMLQMTPDRLILSDFLHDLAHLDAFIENPDFASAYVRVFQTKQQEVDAQTKNMSESEKSAYFTKLDRLSERQSFLFSEASWVFQSGADKIFETTPLLKNLMKAEHYVTESYVRDTLNSNHKEQLLKEFRTLQKNWWQVVNMLGGGGRDVISFKSFSESLYFPMNFVFFRLNQVIEKGQISTSHEIEQVALILRFLQGTDKLNISKWEDFGGRKNESETEVFKVLQSIFKDYKSRDANELDMLAEYLKLPSPHEER